MDRLVVLTDSEKPENKAKLSEKAEFTLVNEHFEEGFNAVIWFLRIRENELIIVP